MDSEDVKLELPDAKTIAEIVSACIQAADWLVDHKDEIIALIKKGWTSAKQIVDYLKKKYGK